MRVVELEDIAVGGVLDGVAVVEVGLVSGSGVVGKKHEEEGGKECGEVGHCQRAMGRRTVCAG